jgi:hypothetical protein
MVTPAAPLASPLILAGRFVEMLAIATRGGEIGDMQNPFKGFLEKRNPRATLRSVLRQSLFGAIGGAILGVVHLSFGEKHPAFEGLAVAVLPAMILIGAIAAAAIEWQGRC